MKKRRGSFWIGMIIGFCLGLAMRRVGLGLLIGLVFGLALDGLYKRHDKN